MQGTNFDELWSDVDCAVQTTRGIIDDLKKERDIATSEAVLMSLNSLISEMEMLRDSMYELREKVDDETAYYNDIKEMGEAIEVNARSYN